ncbi:MAG: nicotinate (nicotinamide) nucleotide adenylyltransferase [Chloroflexi bacterium]|nr:nicotinate (nicotinamide) nucleotide adenylyltransferase [Chloroflexota bacterium]
MSRIGVLGGTFDPPHHGHLIIAEQAREQLDLEKVLWVPAGQPPHKIGQDISPIDHRLHMLRLAIDGHPQFELSMIDVERPGPHYTVHMLEELAAEYPTAELFLIMGSDSLRDLPTWRDPEGIVEQATLAVINRPNISYDLDTLSSRLSGLRDHLVVIESPLIDLSGLTIRALAAQNRTIRYLTLPAVLSYINQHSLYRASVA